MYEFLKTVHIITVVLYVGTVFFRTFAIFKLGNIYSKEESMKIQRATTKEIRKILKVSNILLLLTGIFLFFGYYLEGSSRVLQIKMALGLVLVIAFFMIPTFLDKINASPKFRLNFHYVYFTLLLTVIVLSQYI